MSLELKLLQPNELERTDWRAIQELHRESLSLVIDSESKIDDLVQWDDPDRYYRSHIDPNVEVGHRYKKDQSYSRPRVALAIEGRSFIGYGYAADNVSWGVRKKLHLPAELLGINLGFIDKKEEAYKMNSANKRYFWLREFAARQGNRDVILKVGQLLLESAEPDQPVTHYQYDYEKPSYGNLFEKLGFRKTDEWDLPLFGQETVKQTRLMADKASLVLRKLGQINVR